MYTHFWMKNQKVKMVSNSSDQIVVTKCNSSYGKIIMKMPRGYWKTVYRRTGNGQNKEDKKINSYRQNYTRKLKIEQHELKTRTDHRCPGRMSSFCSTSSIRCAPHAKTQWKLMKREIMVGLWLPQAEHIWRHRYSVSIIQVMMTTVKYIDRIWSITIHTYLVYRLQFFMNKLRLVL